LDEPSIGLHQNDNAKLIKTLVSLRDIGNTVIVVEHDIDTMMSADYILDIGPGAGKSGGRVVAKGTPEEIIKNKNSITGEYLSGEKKIEIPKKRRESNGKFLKIINAKEHNLKNVTVEFPLGTFIGVTGVSGSGKSTLINDILVKAVAEKLYGSKSQPGRHERIEGIEHIDKIINIDQSPIGRTPRSNPATYTGVFTEIREIFAQTPEARLRGYRSGRFSFNVKGGRCEDCKGDGIKKIEMHFLPDIYVPCETCKGKRYNSEALEIKYRGETIADVLDMTVDEALEFFAAIPAIKTKLSVLSEVGLGYICLGQSATTLSGGEAQRIKLATELSKRSTGKTLYILDEPTVGLHFDDVKKLLGVLQQLVDKGNTVITIEHNLDVVKSVDHVIDLGPDGGDGGGEVIAKGTPEDIVKNAKSYTGQWLKKTL
jgi:excinuclease ABC subunit A